MLTRGARAGTSTRVPFPPPHGQAGPLQAAILPLGVAINGSEGFYGNPEIGAMKTQPPSTAARMYGAVQETLQVGTHPMDQLFHELGEHARNAGRAAPPRGRYLDIWHHEVPISALGGVPLGLGDRSPGCGQPLKAATARDVNTARAQTAAQFLAFTGHGLKKK